MAVKAGPRAGAGRPVVRRGAVTPERIMKIGLGFWEAKVLLSAVELGLFTELAKESSLASEALRKQLRLHQRSAQDFFDALVALGLLERQGQVYRNTPETDRFLDRAKPSYIGGILEMAGARLYPFWNALTEALRTGQPQNEVKRGRNWFMELYADPARLRQFLQAMTGLSLGAAQAMAAKFPWRAHRTFLDVGCAQGAMAVQIAFTHRHLRGGGADLPVVGPIFTDYVASFGLSDRLAFHPLDFFNQPLPPAEVILMGHILHDWNLEEKRLLVRKAYEALPKGGAFIAFDAVIDDERRRNAFGLLMSLNMLIETPGGFDYTGADCRGWMKEAGFRRTRVERLAGPDSMVVGIK